jgi:GT2 family glycosyltransferase
MSEVVKHINANLDDDLIYSDEDKLSEKGTFIEPFFKPDWSPDRLMATNYLSHVIVIKKQLMDEVGGFRLGYEGSQDYDLLLRVSEKAQRIGHIPQVLYHWRIHDLSAAGSTDVKPYAYIAAKRALEDALVRRNQPGEVQYTTERGRYRIKYQVREAKKVSIIIPTKDAANMMKNTLDSILYHTDYPNYEIIVLNNNSTTKEFFDLMKGYEEKHKDIFRCVDASFPFNFSKLMNTGAALSTGEYILMLNNDVEILKKDWIDWMVAYAQNETTGAVGVKLLYPDDTIQHAGTIIGLGDDKIAAHAFVGAHKDNPGYNNCLQSATNYAAVTAACLMCRKSVYEQVGGMDENLAVEYNDVDFCLRLIDHGYYNIYLPEVTLYHYESATRGHPHQTRESYERHIREIGIFKKNWNKYIKRDPYYNENLSLDKGFTYNLIVPGSAVEAGSTVMVNA